MSVLKLYTDSALTDMLSDSGSFTNPDEETALDGTAGDTEDCALWMAVEQTTLGAAVTTTDGTSLTLTAARFAATAYSVIIIDSEKMLITAGHGTTGLTVTRGYDSTTPATHLINAPVRLCYDCTAISIDGYDSTGTDESGWLSYCDDNGAGAADGSWEAPHSVSNLAYNADADIWRRVVVPASTAAQYKTDLAHRIAATINEHRVA